MADKNLDFLNLDEESLNSLREEMKGEHDLASFSFVDPQEGETIIGTLNDEESEIAYEWATISEDFAKLGDTIMHSIGDRFQQMQRSAHKAERDRAVLFAQTRSIVHLMTSKEEEQACKFMLRAPMLKAQLFYMVAERNEIYPYFVGLRSKGQIVTWGRRASNLMLGG